MIKSLEGKPVDTDDIIYFDATVYNDSQDKIIPASFNALLNKSILLNPADYYMAVARFSISHLEIPILFFKRNFYSVTVEVGGVANQIFVNLNTTINNVSLRAKYGFIGEYDTPVYSYFELIDGINTSLDAAHTATGAPGPAPFMTYNQNTERFGIFYPQDYIANNVFLYFNAPLFQLFEYFYSIFNGYNQPNGEDYLILPVRNPSFGPDQGQFNEVILASGASYYEIIQERTALYLLNQVQNIVFTSNSLPITREYVKVSNSGNPSNLPILADFVPDLSKGRDLSEYQFYPQGPYRLIDLTSDSSINSVDISVGYVLRDGTIFRLFLQPNEIFTCKLAFFKKSSNTW